MHSRLIQETPSAPPFAAEPSVFNRLSRLPALRPSTLRLLSVSIDSDTAMAEFENVFRSDPVLAADLLILANSPAFGVRATVHNIRHAIALLGMERIRSLAFAVAVKGYLRTGRWANALQVSWRHSIATAVIAEALGAADENSVPLLYTAGLMHDVGRLALFQISAEKYGQVLTAEFGSVQEYLNLEKLLFGCAHDDAGAFLAAAWGFPTTLCDCIRFHHWDVAVHAGQLFELVGVACRVADSLGYPEVNRADLIREPDAVAALLPPRFRESPGLGADILQANIEKQLETFDENGGAKPRLD
ncbi:MAG TPA: HDOD domain-containing protein [Bryobacteraceae bacterium]|nr:HDOD domain-containing protein [Bryobacteraceae bacterium]